MTLNKTYRLDRIAGPSVIFSGYLLIVAGLVTLYFSLSAIVLMLLGATLSFSFHAVEINTTAGYFRPHLRLWGIMKIGERRPFPKEGILEIKPFSSRHTASSLSNRIRKSGVTDFRIYLKTGRANTLLAKCSTQREATEELKQLSPVFEHK